MRRIGLLVLFTALLAIAFPTVGNGQFLITGPDTGCVGTNYSYTYNLEQADPNNPCFPTLVNWIATGGTILSQSTYQATVRWDSQASYHWIQAYAEGSCCDPNEGGCWVGGPTINTNPLVGLMFTTTRVFKDQFVVWKATHIARSDTTWGNTGLGIRFNQYDSLRYVPSGCASPPCTLQHTIVGLRDGTGPNCTPKNQQNVAATIYVFPIPVLSASGYAFEDSPVTFSITNYNYAGVATQYRWYRNDSLIATNTSQSITSRVHGRYSVEVVISSQPYARAARSNEVNTTSRQHLTPSGITNNRNYIIENTIPFKGLTALPGNGWISDDSIRQVVNYSDGLGRTIQSQAIRATPLRNDIVTFVVYDSEGRADTSRNAYVSHGVALSSKGSFRTNALAEQRSFYTTPLLGIESNTKPKSHAVFDRSPLSRVLKADKPSAEYSLQNSRSDSVLVHRYTGSPQIWRSSYNPVTDQVTFSSSYATGELVIRTTYNANRNWTRTYSDLSGRKILTEAEGGAGQIIRTQNVYDAFGRVVRVFQPMVQHRATNTWNEAGADSHHLKAFCFRYRYDDQGQLVARWVPGKDGWERTVYFKNGLVAYTQNAQQQVRDSSRQSYAFTQYDNNGRAVVSGEFRSTVTADQLQSTINSLISSEVISRYGQLHPLTGYSSLGMEYLPGSPMQWRPEAVFYFDDYDHDRIPTPADSGFIPTPGYTHDPLLLTSGLATMHKARLIRESIPSTMGWFITRSFHDKDGRVVQVREDSLGRNPGRITHQTTIHDGAGRVQRKHTPHTHEGFVYDRDLVFRITFGAHMSKHYQAQYDYNELGQVVRTYYYSYGGRKWAETVDFAYHPLGMRRRINNRYFTQELFFERGPDGALSGRYDGKITRIRERLGLISVSNNEINWYYGYDAPGRLISVAYTENTFNGTTRGPAINHGKFDEHLSYDRNSSITQVMRRYNYQVVDSLFYRRWRNGVPSPRLQNVVDAGNSAAAPARSQYISYNQDTSLVEFEYDREGNLLFDGNRSAGFTYNRLNRIRSYTYDLAVAGSYVDRTSVQVEYDGLGRRRQEVRVVNRYLNGNFYRKMGETRTEYDGLRGGQHRVWTESETVGLFVAGSGPSGPTRYFSSGVTQNGYITLSDHLGSARVVVDTTGQLIERNVHYAYGLRIEALSSQPVGGSSTYDWGWAGGQRIRENDVAFTLQVHGVRVHDQALAVWHGVEPKAEMQVSLSTYSYAFGDPVGFVDQDGLFPLHSGERTDIENALAADRARMTMYISSMEMGGSSGGSAPRMLTMPMNVWAETVDPLWTEKIDFRNYYGVDMTTAAQRMFLDGRLGLGPGSDAYYGQSAKDLFAYTVESAQLGMLGSERALIRSSDFRNHILWLKHVQRMRQSPSANMIASLGAGGCPECDEIEYSMLVWGASKAGGEALQSGNYLEAGGWFLVGLSDMFAVRALAKLGTQAASRTAAAILPRLARIALTSSINSVDDLLRFAGKLERLKGGVRQGVIANANADAIYKRLVAGATLKDNGGYILFDGSHILLKTSESGLRTIYINVEGGMIYKIRFIP